MQLFGVEWPIASEQDLLDQKEEILKKADKKCPETLSLLCLIKCLENKEEEALELLPKIVEEEKKRCLGQLLVNHFYCKKLISEKLNLNLSKANNLYKKAQKYSGLTHEDYIGITIGASIIVKNEEKFLEQCLKSLQGVVDEIVVVDTGSTDQTINIAKKYNSKIGYFEWCHDFSAARNFALSLNTTHWVMLIDADNKLEQNNLFFLLDGISRPHYGGYVINIIDHKEENDDTVFFTHNETRVFQRLPGIHFKGKIHEQIGPSLIENGYLISYLRGVNQHHYGYIESVVNEKDKNNRALNLLLEEIKKDPHNYFHWFNLANTYSCTKEWEECIRASEQAVQYLPVNTSSLGIFYYNWAVAFMEIGEIKKALTICDEFDQKNGSSHAMLNYVRAEAYFQLGDMEKSLEWVNQCHDKPENLYMDQHQSIKNYLALFLKGKVLLELNRYEESINVFTEVLKRKPDFYQASFLRELACSYNNQYLLALRDFLNIRKNGAYIGDINSLIAKCYFEIGQPKEGIKSLKNISLEFNVSEELLILWFAHVESNDDFETIQTHFNQIQNPSPELKINYGRAMIHFNLIDLAEEQFKSVLQNNELDANAWFNLGDLYLNSGEPLKAKESYESALILQKDNLDGWLNLGNSYISMNDYSKAIDCYAEVLTRDPYHYAALENLKIISGLQTG